MRGSEGPSGSIEEAEMKRETRSRPWITLLLVGAIACGARAQVAVAQETGGDTGATDDEKVVFTWGGTAEPTSLNPMSGYSAIDAYFWTPQYHLLIDFDVNFDAEPGLATEVETSDDNMTFTYTISDRFVWSDGEPVTAEDVAYTMNLYKTNHAYIPQGFLELIDGEVRVVDDTHIQFDTLGPTSLYTGERPYMYFYILPKHVFEQIEQGNCPDGADPCTPKSYENVPSVGSGPFTIAEYEVGQFVRMIRNPYWTGSEPAIDEIFYRIYRNEDALSQALLQGEVDFAYLTTPNVFNSLEGQENIGTMVGSIPSFSEIGLNTGSAYQEAGDGFTPHGDGYPALTDVTVRQAIRMAINSEELVDKVLLGYGSPGDSIVPPVTLAGARWEPEGDEKLAWDIPAANQLLEDAGYTDTDGDGVREMPAGSLEPGRPLEFRYYVRPSDQTSVDASSFISEWLDQIGIEAEVIAVTTGRLGDFVNGGTYDMFSWGWYPDVDPGAVLSWMKCDQRPPDGSTYGNDDSYYCNPEFDQMYLDQQQALDVNDRWEIVHEMQKMFYEDAAYSVLWYDPYLQAYRTDRFTGYNSQPPQNGDLLEGWGGISDVWLTLRPVSETEGGGGSSVEARGVSPLLWAGIAAVLVIGAVVLFARRRRVSDEDS
jgi:peptide/nickel transport system substrate-binding protein